MRSLEIKKEVISRLSKMPKNLGDELSMLMDQDDEDDKDQL